MDLLSVMGRSLLLLVVGPVAGQNYVAWDRVLHAHVAAGVKDGISLSTVDYGAVAGDSEFHTFLASLEAARVDGLSELDWKALFINAYNAFAMHMVIRYPCRNNQGQCAGPIQSIGEVGGAPGAVWALPAGRIGGQEYTLQQIEDLLRLPPAPFAADPRIHACINCASVSCPNLRAEPYQGYALDGQMAEQMRMLVMNQQKGLNYDMGSNVMTLSEIFDWSRVDFERSAQSVSNFVAQYLPYEERARIATVAPQIGYFPWDKNLNGEAPCICGQGTSIYS